ncbi:MULTISPECIES: hypothetical protein [Sphingobacterium]|uniref:hypothetical protein n=1 Tax=Sphingobacterium TaxID=28453 RepID=UPI00257D373E|nr:MULTISPECIES: hypothetical protein [Sphingobacterium]
MNQGIKTVRYPVQDMAQSKALFAKLLDVESDLDSPYYMGVKVDHQDIGLANFKYYLNNKNNDEKER